MLLWLLDIACVVNLYLAFITLPSSQHRFGCLSQSLVSSLGQCCVLAVVRVGFWLVQAPK